jgi:hypothetical protein
MQQLNSGNLKITKDDFNEEVDFLGYGFNSHGAYASTLSKYSGRVLQLLTYGALYLILLRKNLIKKRRNYLKV